MASPPRPHSIPIQALALLALTGPWPPSLAAAEPLEEIVVTASLREEPLAGLAASVTVLDEATVQAAGVRHFADLLGLVPNLNWAGGSSRPRYLQLRGIGELEQYQGAPNPSVAFLVDEFDLSGIGMPASTVDVEQVEVLRGPQGTRYGANALAGMVKLKTRDADGEPELRTRVEAGGDDLYAASLAAGGALAEGNAAWRLAVQRQRQDGFRDNVYLDRTDTNVRDETTLRGKFRVELGERWQAEVGGLYVDLDNGYDAFVPDNSLRTMSDRPGRDAQRTTGISLRLRGDLGAGELSSATAWVDSDIVYSFDGDWGNDAYWGEYAPYDYFTRYGRERSTLSEDLRWLAGEARRPLALAGRPVRLAPGGDQPAARRFRRRAIPAAAGLGVSGNQSCALCAARLVRDRTPGTIRRTAPRAAFGRLLGQRWCDVLAERHDGRRPPVGELRAR